MTATEFRAKCLGLFDWVAETGGTIIVTKRGKPLVRVVPMSPQIELEKPSGRDAKGQTPEGRRG
jgi:prevent-host-death family protein